MDGRPLFGAVFLCEKEGTVNIFLSAAGTLIDKNQY